MDVIDEYGEWLLTRKGNTALTVYQYTKKLRDLQRWVGPRTVLSCDFDDLDGWVRRETAHTGVVKANSPATQNKDITICKTFFVWALRRGLVEVDPTVDLIAPKVRNKNPRPIADALWRSWYNARHVDNDALLFTGLGYLVGLRRMEACRLRGDMINERTLVISGLVRKGGGDDVINVADLVAVIAMGRPDLLPDEGAKFLELLRERARHDGPVFAWGDSHFAHRRSVENVLPDGYVDPQWVYRRIQRWAKEAFVDPYKPHDLRHSFVTNLLRCNVPMALVSSLANHSSYEVTSRYSKLGNAELRDVVSTMRNTRQAPISRYS